MVDVESVAAISTEASGEAFPWSGVTDLLIGGDDRNTSQLFLKCST